MASSSTRLPTQQVNDPVLLGVLTAANDTFDMKCVCIQSFRDHLAITQTCRELRSETRAFAFDGFDCHIRVATYPYNDGGFGIARLVAITLIVKRLHGLPTEYLTRMRSLAIDLMGKTMTIERNAASTEGGVRNVSFTPDHAEQRRGIFDAVLGVYWRLGCPKAAPWAPIPYRSASAPSPRTRESYLASQPALGASFSSSARIEEWILAFEPEEHSVC